MVTRGEQPFGLFKSTNGGTNWTQISVAGAENIKLVAVDPAAAGIVYASATNGLFKSLDGGETWNLTGLEAPVLTLGFDPADASIVYAGTSIPGPKITGASLIGKKLIVTGDGFDPGAKILVVLGVDGALLEKTINDAQNPTSVLIAPKAGKHIAPGRTVNLTVVEPDSTASPPFSFTRPLT